MVQVYGAWYMCRVHGACVGVWCIVHVYVACVWCIVHVYGACVCVCVWCMVHAYGVVYGVWVWCMCMCRVMVQRMVHVYVYGVWIWSCVWCMCMVHGYFYGACVWCMVHGYGASVCVYVCVCVYLTKQNFASHTLSSEIVIANTSNPNQYTGRTTNLCTPWLRRWSIQLGNCHISCCPTS